jgi:hypothetical protein
VTKACTAGSTTALIRHYTCVGTAHAAYVHACRCVAALTGLYWLGFCNTRHGCYSRPSMSIAACTAGLNTCPLMNGSMLPFVVYAFCFQPWTTADQARPSSVVTRQVTVIQAKGALRVIALISRHMQWAYCAHALQRQPTQPCLARATGLQIHPTQTWLLPLTATSRNHFLKFQHLETVSAVAWHKEAIAKQPLVDLDW